MGDETTENQKRLKAHSDMLKAKEAPRIASEKLNDVLEKKSSEIGFVSIVPEGKWATEIKSLSGDAEVDEAVSDLNAAVRDYNSKHDPEVGIIVTLNKQVKTKKVSGELVGKTPEAPSSSVAVTVKPRSEG